MRVKKGGAKGRAGRVDLGSSSRSTAQLRRRSVLVCITLACVIGGGPAVHLYWGMQHWCGPSRASRPPSLVLFLSSHNPSPCPHRCPGLCDVTSREGSAGVVLQDLPLSPFLPPVHLTCRPLTSSAFLPTPQGSATCLPEKAALVCLIKRIPATLPPSPSSPSPSQPLPPLLPRALQRTSLRRQRWCGPSRASRGGESSCCDATSTCPASRQRMMLRARCPPSRSSSKYPTTPCRAFRWVQVEGLGL